MLAMREEALRVREAGGARAVVKNALWDELKAAPTEEQAQAAIARGADLEGRDESPYGVSLRQGVAPPAHNYY